MTSALTIRLATSADAATLATIHLNSWQWAYQGLAPDAYLEQLG